MAIKGKGRTRSRRVIAAPPRPQLYVRKPPMWRRRWVWAVVGTLAVAGALAVVLASLHTHHVRAERDRAAAFKLRESTAVNRLSAQLVPKFPTDAKLIPPDLPEFFPALSTDLDKLGKGQLTVKDATAEADAVTAAAKTAQTGVQAINVAKLIPTEFTITGRASVQGKGGTQQELLDGQFLMAQGFQLYQQVGAAMKEAAGATGPQRTALVTQAKDLLAQASALFDRGYAKLLQIRQALGLPSLTRQPTTIPTIPAPVPSVPATGTPSPGTTP